LEIIRNGIIAWTVEGHYNKNKSQMKNFIAISFFIIFGFISCKQKVDPIDSIENKEGIKW